MTPCRILLAEDNLPLRALLRFVIDADSRFDVVGEADDGLAAVALVEAHDPDLVLLDLSMPVMGAAVCLTKGSAFDGLAQRLAGLMDLLP